MSDTRPTAFGRRREAAAAGLLTLVLSLPAPGASATALDLSAFADGSLHGDGLAVAFDDGSGDVATLDNFFDRDIRFASSNFVQPERVFCFLQQFGCGATGAVVFTTAVQDLSFVVEQTSTLSNVRAEAYRDGALVASLRWNDIVVDPAATYPVGATRLFDFSGIGPVTSLILNSVGDTAFYGDFDFDRAAAVPAPAAAWLLLAGLIGLRARTLRRR